MDIHGEGYITIEQLRRALNKFAFPMTDKVFEDLMERYVCSPVKDRT